MFGPRLTTVFASRWKALWWAAGILMTAYCSVPRQGETDPMVGTAAALAGAAGATATDAAQAAPEHHANPWDKDSPATSA